MDDDSIFDEFFKPCLTMKRGPIPFEFEFKGSMAIPRMYRESEMDQDTLARLKEKESRKKGRR